MSKLENLLETLCPDGVEYKRLGEVSIMQRGTSITKNNILEGDIPVISGGKEPAYYCNICNRQGETITVAGSGAGAGYVQFWDKPIFVCDAFSIKGQSNVSTKFLYYCLTNKQEYIYSTKKGGGVPHVHISSIEQFKIPVPPIEVQKEIVKILDNFTMLSEKLSAELTARKKQYEFYRDKLLTFDKTGVEYKRIKEVFTRLKGTPITAEKMKQIANEQGNIKIFAGGKTVINAFEKDIPNANITTVPAVLVQSRGVIDVVYYDKPFTFKNEMWAYTHTNLTTLKFLYYVMKNNIQMFRDSASGMGALPQISLSVTEDFKIPVPPLDVQERIVNVLDNFDAICSDLKIGLPSEIEKRRQQYEYYRDKLLTFKEKV